MRWVDPFSPIGLREATAKILTGTNYRLFFESVTRNKLVDTYRSLAEIAGKYPEENTRWKHHIKDSLLTGDLTEENKQLRYWLVGLTIKTAQNLGYETGDLPDVFDQVMGEFEEQVSAAELRETALLIWAGAATLTIRGSQKSKVGKRLEKSVARAALSVIGLKEDEGHFRLNVGADKEVGREIDAEVRTRRGYIQVEVGMIGKGNPEVIADKVGRVGRNGVILMDLIPSRSSAYETARQHGVKLIQLRNNHPVEELRQHLYSLSVPVRGEAISSEEVENNVLNLPLEFFQFDGGESN